MDKTVQAYQVQIDQVKRSLALFSLLSLPVVSKAQGALNGLGTYYTYMVITAVLGLLSLITIIIYLFSPKRPLAIALYIAGAVFLIIAGGLLSVKQGIFSGEGLLCFIFGAINIVVPLLRKTQVTKPT